MLDLENFDKSPLESVTLPAYLKGYLEDIHFFVDFGIAILPAQLPVFCLFCPFSSSDFQVLSCLYSTIFMVFFLLF